MSTSRDSCCLPSVKKQKHDFQVFAFVQCIIKQLLGSVFVISRIIKVSVRVISLSLRLRLITLTSTLIMLDITKTSSNNCLLFKFRRHLCKGSILSSKHTNRPVRALVVAPLFYKVFYRTWSRFFCSITMWIFHHRRRSLSHS